MKKSLVLSLALAASVAACGTAFAAANPFADVPSKHWAYDAVSQLAKDGIVDGYSDKTFQGDKTMTRYEMAQVVGKAVARADKASAADKKLIDKLSNEFAGELNNLGVRVAKLEANQSNVKFSGYARVRYDNLSDKKDGQMWKDRLFFNMNSKINENTTMYARFVFSDDKFNQESGQRLSDLAMTTKFNKTDVTLGRYTLNMGPTCYFSGTTGDLDGITTNSQFGNFGLKLGYAQARQTIKDVTGATSATLIANNLFIKNVEFAEATYAVGKAKLFADYFKNLNVGASDGNSHTVLDAYKIAGGAVTYTFDSNWKAIAEYYKNGADQVAMADGGDPTATLARVQYKGVSSAKQGSFGAMLEYGKIEANAMPYGFTGAMIKLKGTDVGLTANDGVKYYNLQADYAVAKNVVFTAIHQFNIKNAETGDKAPNSTYSRAQINYYF
jgi:hypothetical protein